MRNFTTYNLKKFLFLPLAVALFCLNGCKKDEVANTNYAILRVVNASAALNTYNVYLNNSIVNSVALPYAGSVNYFQKDPGSYTIKFTPASTAESIYSTTANLGLNTYNSFYLVGKTTALGSLLVTDDLSLPNTAKAYIRLVHLSPDAPAVDLAKTGSDKLITNRTFKTASSFVAVDPGTISLDILDNATGTVKTTLTTANFTAGFHYDILVGGYLTPANDTEKALNISTILIK